MIVTLKPEALLKKILPLGDLQLLDKLLLLKGQLLKCRRGLFLVSGLHQVGLLNNVDLKLFLQLLHVLLELLPAQLGELVLMLCM